MKNVWFLLVTLGVSLIFCEPDPDPEPQLFTLGALGTLGLLGAVGVGAGALGSAAVLNSISQTTKAPIISSSSSRPISLSNLLLSPFGIELSNSGNIL